MKPALIVVDMQPKFQASNCERTLGEVLKLIEQFKKQQQPIYVVEYEDFGDSHTSIYDALRGYDKYFVVSKDEDGGADNIICCAENEGIEFDCCVVCGVNYDYCVYETAKGLANDYNKVVTIAERACNSTNLVYEDCWNDYRGYYESNGIQIEFDDEVELKAGKY